MTIKAKTWTITGTSPASASQAAVGNVITGLDEMECFDIAASLVGATGGTLDVYLQRKLDTDIWVDWVHFPQLAAGAAAIKYHAAPFTGGSACTAVGITADNGTSGAPALAANTVVGGHPGHTVRMLCVAGASTSAGAALVIRVQGWRESK